MIGRKTKIGVCALGALAVSAIVAQGVSAAGTTAYTCKGVAPGTGTFKAAHCKSADAGTGNFNHVSIANGTTTEVLASDLNTAGEHVGAELKATVAGSSVALHANEVSGSGSMANSESIGEMIASGEGVLKFSGVTETFLGCTVVGIPGGPGVVETKQLFATTQGVGDKVKVTPKTGTILAEFELTSCVVASTYKVVGSVLGVPDGATYNTVHSTVTAEKTLRLQSPTGPLAGLESSITLSGRSGGSGAYTPLSVTT